MDAVRRSRVQNHPGSRARMSPLPRGIRRLFRLGSVERDLDEELSAHFACTVDELIARGYSRTDAQEEARRRFGDESRYRDELHAIDVDRARGLRWLERI